MSMEFEGYKGFIYNKYHKIYVDLIECQRTKSSTGYTENHHILPKSLGGSNGPDNMVRMDPRAHFIAHLLLTKFTKGRDRKSMMMAFFLFFHSPHHKNMHQSIDHKLTSRMYMKCKESVQETFRENGRNTYNPEILMFKNMDTGEVFEGNRRDFREHTGLTSQEVRNLVNGNFRHAKRWGVWKNWGFSCDQNKKPPNPTKKIECPHCHKTSDARNFKRWHGDRCSSILTPAF